MAGTFNLTEIHKPMYKDAESTKTTVSSTVRRHPRSLTVVNGSEVLTRVASLPSIFKGIKPKHPSSDRSAISTPQSVLPIVSPRGSLASRFLINTPSKATVIDTIKESVAE